MKTRIIIIALALVLMAVTGCTSFDFQLSQTEGLHIKIEGAPPTLYKLGSYENTTDEPKAFDLFHFESRAADGPGTLEVDPDE